jgi:hypothetical protein
LRRFVRKPVAALILCLSVLGTRGVSAGERCEEPPDARARYEHALTALERGRQAARLWWIGWTSGYSVATAAQGAVALVTTDHGTRVDSIVGAAESAFGVIGMLVATPRTPMWASDALLAMDDRTACDRVRRLRRAEELLRKSAEEEERARSWYSQLIGDAINLAAPAVLWIGYQRYASGWYTLVPGIAIQEAQILSQPTAAISAWNSHAAAFGEPPRVEWHVIPLPGGVGVAGVF